MLALAVLATCAALLPTAAQPVHEPLADPAAVVLCSASTRLTLLSPLLVRAEHDAASRFEDRASLAFVNRRLPVPEHTVRNTSAWCNVTFVDGGVTVSYSKLAQGTEGSELLTGGLQVRTASGDVMWAGLDAARAAANLGGTVYDLKGQNGSLCGKEMASMDICAQGSHIDLACGGNQKTFGDGASYCTHGVLSTLSEQGTPTATLYDDSENTVRESAADGGWWASRQGGDGKDLYLFLHGTDHRAGLRALASVSGHAAVPPRRFFGVWWSRWNKYTTRELHDMAAAYESNGLPLDGINLDTEWHRNQKGYLDGDNENWYSGVFDWDRTLYNSPMAMMDWLETRGLWPAWMDVHQTSGVSPVNSLFPEFAKAVGLPGSYDAHNATNFVPPDIGNRTFVEAFFRLLDGQTGGRNYWWPDNGYGTGLSNQKGLNRVLWDRTMFIEHVNESTCGRPTVFIPFGGLGSGRMPFGHSGDIVTSWETLQFLPYYSATASNVLYSYIAHDVGGHRDYGHGNDPELYTRSMQYCAFSAQLRPHAAKTVGLVAPGNGPADTRFDRRAWEFPYEYFEPMREAMHLRSRFLPYTYTAALRGWISPDRPFIRGVYVDFPADPQAVTLAQRKSGQYMFGDRVLVQPIVTQLDPLTNLTAHQLYFPMFEEDSAVGQRTDDAATVAWVERSSGRCFLGGESVRAGYRLSETAEFIRPGSILPMVATPSALWNADNYANTSAVCPSLSGSGTSDSSDDHLGPPKHLLAKPLPAALLGAASRVPCAIEWHVYLGNATAGSGELLEDDGESSKYMTGLGEKESSSSAPIARTVANYTFNSDDRSMLFELGGQVGNYAGSPAIRWISVVVHNVLAPVSAELLFPTSGVGIMNRVGWDAATLTATVEIGAVAVAQGVSFQLGWAASPRSQLLCRSGRTGWARLNQRVIDTKREIDWEGSRPTQAAPSMLLNMLASTATRMQEAPHTAASELSGFDGRLAAAVKLHTTMTGKATGLPSPGLQRLIKAWLLE